MWDIVGTIYRYDKRTENYGYETDFDEFLPCGYGNNSLNLSLFLLDY